MDTLDLLLGEDLTKIQLPTGEKNITRLSKALGKPVVFKYRALTPDEDSEIRKNGIKLTKKGDLEEIDSLEMQCFQLLHGVVEPDLKSPKLAEKYGGGLTPVETIKKLLLAGEISAIASEIQSLSGFDEESVEDIKNE